MDALTPLIFIGVILTFYLMIKDIMGTAGKGSSSRRTVTRKMPKSAKLKPDPPQQAPAPPVPGTIQGQRSDGGGLPVKGVFVVVTASDPQTQMVAMSLANQILAKGKSVRVLLCGPGGDLALKDGKQVILKPLNKSPQMLLNNLIQNGVAVEVCPFYVANRDTPPELMDGIQIAKPPVVADGLLEPGIKLFTF